MGIFGKLFGGKSPDASPVTAAEMNASEQALLTHNRNVFRALAQMAGLKGDPAVDAPSMGDQLIVWWHAQPEAKRPDPNDIVFAIGIAIGDGLAPKLGLRWMIVTDSFGTSLALYAAASGRYTELVISPVDSVAKRFATSSPGALQHYASATLHQIAEMRKQ